MSRAAIVLFGCAVAWIMGVRTPRAASFGNVEFAGKGRATLVIDESEGADDLGREEEEGAADAPDPAAADERFGLLEVFAKMTYGTEISAFAKGLYARSTFTFPRTGATGVLVIDVDRADDAKDWKAGDRGLRARLYTIPKGGEERFDGQPMSGSLDLEAAIVGRNAAGFRIRGWLEMRDPGPDGRVDTDDDVVLEVDLTLESIPSPEEIAGQPAPPPRQPQGGFCEAPWCWTDDGYYDGYSYGYGCGDADVGYDTTSDGCEGDTIGDDGVGIDDGSGIDDGGSTGAPGPDEVTSSDDGCSGESTDTSYDDDPGCEGSDDGTSSDGCDGGDSGSDTSGCSDSGSDTSGCGDSGSSSSGCSDTSGSSSGCGSSGCEGDTLERVDAGGGAILEQDDEGLPKRAGVELVGLGFFVAAMAAWISDARGRRGGGD